MDKASEVGGKAVVLLSGGIDSTTAMWVARSRGHFVYALTFDYGQRHRLEVDRAREVAGALGVERHLVLELELDRIAGSVLTGPGCVPKDRDITGEAHEIPGTYVPARNTVFLSLGLTWAETLDAGHLFIGANAVDYSGYPDCRPEYIQAFQKMADLATRRGVEGRPIVIEAPLINMTKAEIVRLGDSLGVDYGMTASCYDPDERGRSCGRCDSCRFRRKAFQEAGVVDPTVYID